MILNSAVYVQGINYDANGQRRSLIRKWKQNKLHLRPARYSG